MRYDDRTVYRMRKTAIYFYCETKNGCSLRTNDSCFCSCFCYQRETCHKTDYARPVSGTCWSALARLPEI